MKRGAESQLTKEELESEEGYDEPESTTETGFKKASDEILKTRVIRGLPNRTKPSGAQSSSTNGTTASPLFPSSVALSSSSAFALPSPAAASNPFASPATNSSDSMNTSRSSLFGKFDTQPRPFGTPSQTSSPFNSTNQTITPTPFTFQSSSDKSVSSASSTVKAFASVLNNSDSNIFGSPAPNNSSSSSNQPAATDEEDPVLFNYYINLRGLNHSLLNAISKGIEDDPFADMSGFLESYKSTYLRIQKEKNDVPAVSKPEPSSNSTPPKPSSNLFSMPAAGSPFGKPPAQEAQSPFSAPVAFSTPSSTSTSLFSPPSAGVQPFTFGVSAQKPSLFNPPEQTSSATTTSAFGSSPSPFKFGGSTTNQSSPSIFGSTKPASTFKWGATDQSTTGDPIGASDRSSTTPTPPTSHFQFGSGSSGVTQSQSKTAISTDEKTADDVAEREGSEQGTSATEGGGESSGSPSNLLAAHNPHDDEGEGEENEISVHAIKVKAYRMRKADAKGGPGWADLGFGILRLKKDKDTSARRMLLRNSTNGKILINFKIYSGLKPSLVKKALSFVGHDNGVSQTYCVRLPGEEQAQRLKEALDKEIESVTAKDKE